MLNLKLKTQFMNYSLIKIKFMKKNIFLVQTDKPSRLHNKNGELGNYPSTKLYIEDFKGNQHNSFHIYITNTEEIKDRNCWVTNGVEIFKPLDLPEYALEYANRYWKKIILTTDLDLISDGIQEISEDFLQWFVQNSDCEEAEVKWVKTPDGIFYHKDNVPYGYYKVILPQEEPKQYPIGGYAPGNYYCNCITCKQQFFGDKRAVQCEPCAIEMVNVKVNINKQTEESKQDLEKDIFENLKEYYKNTPRAKVLEDWNKSSHLDKVGPTVDEFLENSQEQRLREAAKNSTLNFMVDSKQFITKLSYREYGEYGYEKGFIEGAKSDVARDYWYEKFKKEQDKNIYNKEDLKFAYMEGGDDESIYKTFYQWFENFKNK
jgi:hypothetical protein